MNLDAPRRAVADRRAPAGPPRAVAVNESARERGIRLKRAYDEPEPADGTRVLVERLWPRGVSKEAAALDLWLKEIAPSAELRQWYGHDPERWGEFERRYRAELDDRQEAVQRLAALAREGPLTLVLASRDVERSSAALLRRYVEEVLDRARDDGP